MNEVQDKKNYKYDVNEVKLTFNEMGYTLIESLSDMTRKSTPFVISDVNGYMYEVSWYELNKGKRPLKFHKGNPFSIQNINMFFKLELNNEFECIDSKYVNNTTPLKFKHNKCGTEFFTSWSYISRLKYKPEVAYCQCPECNTYKLESHHASALKQVFVHNYPDTITEEQSCINPKTLRVLPTDIVNHRLRIAIEVQSEFHDYFERKERDKIKKDFWIKRGYQFYSPDIRNYTILEMIQLFFPEIDRIPEYVDFNYSNCIDFEKVQRLLNDGLTIKEIATNLNLNENSVRYLSTIHKIELPEDYKSKVFNIHPIVRLSKEGKFIKKYESINSLDRDGFVNGTVRRVLKGKQDFSYDSFWLYEEDYLSGNYIIPKVKTDKFLVPVKKYDMDNNYICTYKTLYEAEDDSISSRNEIYRVAKGERKSSRNEKWKFIN